MIRWMGFRGDAMDTRIAALAAGLLVVSAHAAPIELKTWGRVRQDFADPDCRAHDDCNLVKFSVVREDYRISGGNLPSPSWGTRGWAVYRTDRVAALETYGIAQFVRGCVFASRLRDGRVEKQPVAHAIQGKNIPYRHRDWIIDGFVADPIDWGDQPMPSRHFFYKWNDDPESLDFYTAKHFGTSPPTSPALFVADHPGMAYWSETGGEAQNVSLEMRTCLYKTADVPLSVPYDRVNFATPLKCFDWSSSFIYDFASKSFKSKPGLDPYCLETPAPGEAPRVPMRADDGARARITGDLEAWPARLTR